LYAAIHRGSESVISMLLDCGAYVNEYDPNISSFPLYIAVNAKNAMVVLLLLNRGADLSLFSGGYTALHLAARLGLLDIAEILLDCGADVNHTGRGEESALSIASRKGHKDMVIFLRSRGAEISRRYTENSLLHDAVSEIGASKEVITFLLDEGIDINSRGTVGITPLHRAIEHSTEHIVEHLMLFGANPRARSTQGLTPLDYA
ncbi:ankyrin repeat-containing domain protein, partial [Trichophaea hybrida]